jgi:hypothetical protein
MSRLSSTSFSFFGLGGLASRFDPGAVPAEGAADCWLPRNEGAVRSPYKCSNDAAVAFALWPIYNCGNTVPHDNSLGQTVAVGSEQVWQLVQRTVNVGLHATSLRQACMVAAALDVRESVFISERSVVTQ